MKAAMHLHQSKHMDLGLYIGRGFPLSWPHLTRFSQPSAARRIKKRRGCQCQAAFALRGADGVSRQFEQGVVVVGSAADSGIKVEGPHVGAEHAQIAQKRGGVFCTALQGDEDDLSSRTHTWIDGCEIRRGVSYAIASGAKVAFGQPDCLFVVVFDESTNIANSPLFETMLKGMVAGGSADVQRKIKESLE